MHRWLSITWTNHRRPKLISWTRTWLLLASGVVLQTVIYKGLYGMQTVFLRSEKKCKFLNKINLPYCFVVFFVVCSPLRPFWSVFGELALFWCSTAKRSGTVEQWNTKIHFFSLLRKTVCIPYKPFMKWAWAVCGQTRNSHHSIKKLRENHRTREITRARVSRRELQSTLFKTDTFGTGTKCSSYRGDRGVRLIEVSVKRESTVLVV